MLKRFLYSEQIELFLWLHVIICLIKSLILSNRIEFNNSNSNSIRNRIEFIILYSIRFDLRRIEFNSKFDNSIGALGPYDELRHPAANQTVNRGPGRASD
jgi:hypothetical protein